MKDVGVEEVARIGDDLVRHPSDPPHGKQRIAEVWHGREVGHLFVKHRADGRRQRQSDEKGFPPPWKRPYGHRAGPLAEAEEIGDLFPRSAEWTGVTVEEHSQQQEPNRPQHGPPDRLCRDFQTREAQRTATGIEDHDGDGGKNEDESVEREDRGAAGRGRAHAIPTSPA